MESLGKGYYSKCALHELNKTRQQLLCSSRWQQKTDANATFGPRLYYNG